MNRRSFFRAMVGGVATAAAVRTWPFRVYSFPTELVMPKLNAFEYSGMIYIMNNYQAEAWESLSRKVHVIDVDRFEKSITIANIPRGVVWLNPLLRVPA